MLLLCYFFLQKKSNQKKVKVLRMTRGGSAYRTDDTAAHPHRLYLCHFRKPILSGISFFSCGTQFPDEYPPRKVYLVPQGYDVFFELSQVRIAWQLWRKFPLYRARFHPTFSNSPQEIIYFFRASLLFFIRFGQGHIIYSPVEISCHFSY